VHVLQDEEARHQPRRQTGLARARLAHRAEAPVEEAPIDLPGQPHQRMAHVDDLIERRTQQILLAIIPWPGHRAPPAEPGLQRITIRLKPESQIARNRCRARAFLRNRLFNPATLTVSISGISVLHGRLSAVQEC
jgi:hypothetical protein